jgi:DNA repair exonuclease SbcCD nuclease subunit
VTEKVDFLLLAGDLYDRDWRDYNTGHFFLRQMALLRDAGIPVCPTSIIFSPREF